MKSGGLLLEKRRFFTRGTELRVPGKAFAVTSARIGAGPGQGWPIGTEKAFPGAFSGLGYIAGTFICT